MVRKDLNAGGAERSAEGADAEGVWLYVLCAGSVRAPRTRSLHPLILERGFPAFGAAVAANVEVAREWCVARVPGGVRFRGVILQSLLGHSASPWGELEWDALGRVRRMTSRRRLPSDLGEEGSIRRCLAAVRAELGAGEELAVYLGACDLDGALYEMDEVAAEKAIASQWSWARGLCDGVFIDAAGVRELEAPGSAGGGEIRWQPKNQHGADVGEPLVVDLGETNPGEKTRSVVAADWVVRASGGASGGGGGASGGGGGGGGFAWVGVEPCASNKPGSDWLGRYGARLKVAQLEQTYEKAGPAQGGAYFSRSVAECRAAGAEFIVLSQRAGAETLLRWHREDGVSVAVGLGVVGGRIG